MIVGADDRRGLHLSPRSPDQGTLAIAVLQTRCEVILVPACTPAAASVTFSEHCPSDYVMPDTTLLLHAGNRACVMRVRNSE